MASVQSIKTRLDKIEGSHPPNDKRLYSIITTGHSQSEIVEFFNEAGIVLSDDDLVINREIVSADGLLEKQPIELRSF